MSILKIKRAAGVLALALTLSGCTSVSAAAELPSQPESRTAVRYLVNGNEAEYLRQMTTAAFYTLKDGELAEGLAKLPEDVTGEYAANETWEIPAGAERGYAFRIRLREEVFWEDGVGVSAGDVLYTVRTLLQSEEHGADYLWLANGDGFRNGRERESGAVISLEEAGYDTVAAAREAGYSRFYVDLSNFWGLEAGWVNAANRTRFVDYAMPAGLDERYVTPAYLYRQYLAEGAAFDYLQGEFVGVTAQRQDVLTLDDVGILMTGDHELVVISEEPVAARTVAARLAALCLLRENPDGAADSECAYGPYRIASADGEEILLERNPFWQGGTEDYPADRIVCRLR